MSRRNRAETAALEELPENVLPNTDLANAHRLKRDHGSDLRYVPAVGWVIWDGKRWTVDESGELHRRAHQVACDVKAHAGMLLTDAARLAATGQDAMAGHRRAHALALQAWAQASQNAKRIEACVMVAKSLLSKRQEDFDCDPWLLTCQNGTVDLRTGQMRLHSREDYITHCCGVPFDAKAEAPTWRATLNQILPDPEVQCFVQRYAGYTLTGSTREQCFVICHGDGANGTSTVLEALRYVLAGYARNASADVFWEKKGSRGTENEIARLRGARFVTAVESGVAQAGRRTSETPSRRRHHDSTLSL